MIKIIKNTMTEPIQIECENCSSIFEYNFSDIQRKDTPGLFGFPGCSERYVICPVCKADIELKRRRNNEEDEDDIT